jgi:hypothetical protein
MNPPKYRKQPGQMLEILLVMRKAAVSDSYMEKKESFPAGYYIFSLFRHIATRRSQGIDIFAELLANVRLTIMFLWTYRLA